jgi:hypothetical protein
VRNQDTAYFAKALGLTVAQMTPAVSADRGAHGGGQFGVRSIFDCVDAPQQGPRRYSLHAVTRP